jgi:hypothetical protein
MDKLIHQFESKSFSGEDIRRLCDKQVRIMKYSDLAHHATLDDALGKHGAAVILYETKPNYGHWIAVHRVKNGVVEVFDPYGESIDAPLEYINPEFARQSGQWPILSELLKNSGYRRVVFNDVPLQRFRSDMNTCGRWCGLRIALRELPLQQFVKLFKGQRHPGDWYTTALTLFV